MTIASAEKVSGLWLEPGDILIERSNTPELVGTARTFRGEKNFAIFPDLLIRVRLFESPTVDYIEAWLHSESTRRYFREAAQGISGTMPKIDQAAIERVLVPIPPAAKQQRISEIVATIEDSLSRAESSAKLHWGRSGRLRQSILASAFTGQLVPQDPADEPASVLLERIRAEWTYASGSKAVRSREQRRKT